MSRNADLSGRRFYFSDDDALDLVPVTDGIKMPNFITNDVWELEEYGMTKRKMSENYSKVTIRLRLKRRPLFYLLNVILPVGILSFMNILSFKIPVTSGERVSYCVSLFLTFMVLLDTISEAMPKVSQTVSYLQVYVNLQLVMGMLITLVSVLLVKMSVNWSDEHVPSWVQALYRITRRYRRMDTATKLVYNGIHDNEELDTPATPVEIPPETMANKTHKPTDPRETIKNLDQAFFYIFLGLFLVMNVVFATCMLTYTARESEDFP